MHVDRATDRVLTLQGTLRAAQNFHAVQVVQVECGPQRGREIHVVDIDADTGLAGRQVEVALSDAANERGIRFTVCGGVLEHRDVGRNVRDVDQVRHVPLFHRLGVHRGDGDRGLLQLLLAELCRDDDFLKRVRRCRGGLVCSRRGLCERGRLPQRERAHRRSDCQRYMGPYLGHEFPSKMNE